MAKRVTMLVLGGKPIGSREIVEYAKSRGAYVIVADYLPPEQSPAKLVADEAWDVSTADLDVLEARAREAGVTAVLAGVHEFNIEKALELCARLSLPSWCTLEQWRACCDKGRFKTMCAESGIDVARRFDPDGIDSIPVECYPLAVKPLDGSGSRGFAKCSNAAEAKAALKKAREFSLTGQALVEEFIEAGAVIIQYTASAGRVVYSGMTDKLSLKAGESGAPIMALQVAPSVHEAEYLERVDGKAVAMFESLGIADGPIWVEAFYKDGRFVFNEMGLRFGGSMTNLLVESISGIDQMAVLYAAATGTAHVPVERRIGGDSLYAIWPVHLRSGRIAKIRGIEQLEAIPAFVARTMVHDEGDSIEDWGSAQQVLAYLHFKASSAEGLVEAMRHAEAVLSVKDEEGREMLYSLFDPDDWAGYPGFLALRIGSGKGEEVECGN